MSLSEIPSPIEVTSWPQVVALLGLLAFLAVPQVIGYLTTSRTARGARDHANAAAENANAAAENAGTAAENAGAAAETAGAIKQTLTENNGGSSIKDYLDRLEAGLTEVRAEQADVRARLEAGPVTTVQANGLRDTIEQEMPDAPNA